MQFNYAYLFILLFSGMVHSEDWPYGNDYLKGVMTASYSDLENKTGQCLDMRKKKFKGEGNEFLYSLSEKEREKVLFFVYQIAMGRCVKDETLNYLNALINYSSVSGDKEQLNKWIKLHGVGNDLHKENNQIIGAIKHIPYKEIVRLSELPEFYYPFNIFDAAKMTSR